MTKTSIAIEAFQKVEIRVGQIVAASLNTRARVPAYALSIDFGAFGLRRSSAQLTEGYRAEELIGRQIVAITNLPPKRVAGVKSEVLVLAALCPEKGTRLLAPDRAVRNGTLIS